MAAAVLGHAARRLGGSGALREAAVSRLSPAVEQLGQRRPMPRFAHTEAAQHPCCTCGKPEKDMDLKHIQRKKEELFDLMAEGYKKYGKDTDSACLKNKALLRDLSGHVEPRSGDPTWEWAQAAKVKQTLVKATGSLTLIAGGTYMYTKTLFWVFDRLKD